MVHIKESRSIYTLESGGGNPVHIYMIVLHCYTTPIATDNKCYTSTGKTPYTDIYM